MSLLQKFVLTVPSLNSLPRHSLGIQQSIDNLGPFWRVGTPLFFSPPGKHELLLDLNELTALELAGPRSKVATSPDSGSLTGKESCGMARLDFGPTKVGAKSSLRSNQPRRASDVEN